MISGHTFGMFALSPLSGRLTDRFGSDPGDPRPAWRSARPRRSWPRWRPPEGGVLLFVALFLLGYGWNLGLRGGPALLTHGLSLAERTRVQGLTDA